MTGPNGDPNFHGGIQLNPYNQPWMLLNSTMIDLYVEYSTVPAPGIRCVIPSIRVPCC